MKKIKKLTPPINLGRVFDVDICQLQSTTRKMQLEKLHLLQVLNIFLQIFEQSSQLNGTQTPLKPLFLWISIDWHGHFQSILVASEHQFALI